jgi:hypothetical protein
MALLLGSLGALASHAVELSTEERAALFLSFEEVEWFEDEGGARHKYFVHLEDPRSSLALRSDKRSAKALLRALEEDPYEYGYCRTGRILASRGADILPQLLEALPGSDSYYRICLVNLLSEISDPQRDAAFVTLLEKILKEGDPDSLVVPAVEPAMRVLASRNVVTAVPVLRAYLESEGIEEELRAAARIALGRMGALDPGSISSVPYVTEAGLNIEGMSDHVALLELLLKYELIKAPLKLVEFEAGDGPTKVLKGTIDGGTWYLRVGPEQGGRVPFYYNWHTGPLSAAGYMGVAERKSGQWIVTYWRMMWIS